MKRGRRREHSKESVQRKQDSTNTPISDLTGALIPGRDDFPDGDTNEERLSWLSTDERTGGHSTPMSQLEMFNQGPMEEREEKQQR